MKLFLIALFALLLAAGAAVAIQYDSGYVLIAYGHTTIEMTLWIAVAVLLILLGLGWLLFSLLRRGAKLSDRLGNFRGGQQQRRSERGVIAYSRGQWLQARRLLLSPASSPKPLINYLLAARASQQLNDSRGIDEALDAAAQRNRASEKAAELLRAELQLDRGQYAEALNTLDGLRRKDRDPAVTLLLVRAYRGLNDASSLRALLPELRKRKLMSESAITELELDALRGELQSLRSAGDVGALLQWWKELGRNRATHGALLQEMIPALLSLGNSEDALKLLRAALKQQWQEELVVLYAGVPADKPAEQLRHAEAWLKQHADSAALQLALGRICLRNELWGKAREYFEDAHRLAPNATICFELARLLDGLGEHPQAANYLREGLQRQGQQLPELPLPKARH